MLKISANDYEYIFEYENAEQFRDYLSQIRELHKEMVAINPPTTVQKASQIDFELEQASREDSINSDFMTFEDLELKFIAQKRKMDKVSASTYKAYASTFNKLKAYFGDTYVYTATIEDYEEFRDYLREEHNLKNKTINNHIAYVNLFLTYAVDYKLIRVNNVKVLENFKEDSTTKENFTDEDIKNIFAYDYEQNYKDIFTIASHTGMRVSEIINLTQECVKQDQKSGIYYFDILQSKTKAGIRKVPIHKNILDDVLNRMKFPLLDEERSNNASQKAILRQLYKVIPKESTKSFHTFRGTFISKCLNNFPEKLLIIQEIVGHSKTKGSLTIDTYAKGFDISLKKEIVDSVFY